MAAKKSFRHIDSLDGIRGLAIIVVFLHHLGFTSLPAHGEGSSEVVRGFATLFKYGHLGVDLFFVLSGYLITTLLLIDRRNPNGYWNFYVKRFFRIVPALVASLAIGIGTGYLNGITVLLSLAFIANYARLLKVPMLGPYWSLSVEEQFYLVWPIAIRKLSFKVFNWIVVAIILIEPVIRFLMNMRGHGSPYFTFVRCDGLAWGALVGATAYYARGYRSDASMATWWTNFGKKLFYGGIAALVVLVAALQVHNFGPQTDNLIFTLSPIFMAGTIALVLAKPGSAVARALAWKPLRFFGDISYAMYLIHLNVMFLYDQRWPLVAGDSAGYGLRIAIVAAISISICALSLKYFERPVMKLRTRYLRA